MSSEQFLSDIHDKYALIVTRKVRVGGIPDEINDIKYLFFKEELS
jgi:hypothetical protein